MKANESSALQVRDIYVRDITIIVTVMYVRYMFLNIISWSFSEKRERTLLAGHVPCQIRFIIQYRVKCIIDPLTCDEVSFRSINYEIGFLGP